MDCNARSNSVELNSLMVNHLTDALPFAEAPHHPASCKGNPPKTPCSAAWCRQAAEASRWDATSLAKGLPRLVEVASHGQWMSMDVVVVNDDE